MSFVVVTGASGYIGGQIALKLKDAGHVVVGIDRRSCPEHLASCFQHFITEDFANPEVLAFIGQAGNRVSIDAIIHCAGTSLVGPSISNPQEYYHNNMVNTLKLYSCIWGRILKKLNGTLSAAFMTEFFHRPTTITSTGSLAKIKLFSKIS